MNVESDKLVSLDQWKNQKKENQESVFLSDGLTTVNNCISS